MTEQLKKAMNERHTVRKFDGTSLSDTEKSTLKERVEELNQKYGLSIVLQLMFPFSQYIVYY